MARSIGEGGDGDHDEDRASNLVDRGEAALAQRLLLRPELHDGSQDEREGNAHDVELTLHGHGPHVLQRRGISRGGSVVGVLFR